jgi:hypothetical protein
VNVNTNPVRIINIGTASVNLVLRFDVSRLMFFAPARSLFNLFIVPSFLDDLRNLHDRAAEIAGALVS